jgi:hypothetical protein
MLLHTFTITYHSYYKLFEILIIIFDVEDALHSFSYFFEELLELIKQKDFVLYLFAFFAFFLKVIKIHNFDLPNVKFSHPKHLFY